jgi:hypothetical protein
MDPVTRCLHCGKRMVPIPSLSGGTELRCLFCDKLDPMEMTETNKWADGPLAVPFPSQPPERTAPAQPASGRDRFFR